MLKQKKDGSATPYEASASSSQDAGPSAPTITHNCCKINSPVIKRAPPHPSRPLAVPPSPQGEGFGALNATGGIAALAMTEKRTRRKSSLTVSGGFRCYFAFGSCLGHAPDPNADPDCFEGKVEGKCNFWGYFGAKHPIFWRKSGVSGATGRT